MTTNLTRQERTNIINRLKYRGGSEVTKPYILSLPGCEVTYNPNSETIRVQSNGSGLQYEGTDQGVLWVTMVENPSKCVNGTKQTLERITIRSGTTIKPSDQRRFDMLLQTVKNWYKNQSKEPINDAALSEALDILATYQTQ